jgi:hypothetical protein
MAPIKDSMMTGEKLTRVGMAGARKRRPRAEMLKRYCEVKP